MKPHFPHSFYYLPFLVLIAAFCVLPGRAQSSDTTQVASSEQRRPSGKLITLSDFGAEDLGYLCLPQQAPIGGVVIIHDRWGLDENTRKLAETFADKGYLAIAVDLYNGRTTNDANQANVFLANLRLESAMNTIQAGVRLLKESPRLKVSRAAVVGYSSGGTVALLAAQQIKDVDAAAVLDGAIAPRDKKISKYRVPICAVFPRSAGTAPAGLDSFQKLMADMRNPLEVDYVESAAPGFDDPRSPSFNSGQAEQGWQFLCSFLQRELSKPPKEPNLIDKVEDFFH